IPGHRRFDEEALAFGRVIELDAHAMQERAVERIALLEEAVRRRMTVTIVTEDRMSDRGEVTTDLVRASLLRPDAKHRVPARKDKAPIPRARRIHLSVLAKLTRDRALARGPPTCSRDVNAARRLRREHRLPSRHRIGVLHEEDEPARADVDAFDG